MNDMMMTSAALRRALLIDAAASGAMGVALAVAAGPLEPLLGLPVPLMRGVGLFLVPFAAMLVWTAARARVHRALVATIIGGNVAWVIASVALLASGALTATSLGAAFVLAQAAAVAVFASLEYGGMREGGAAARRAETGALRGGRA